MLSDHPQAGLITSRAKAAGAICVACLLAGTRLRDVFTYRSPQWHGFHQYDGILPHSLGVAFDLVPYCIMVWLLVTMLRSHKGAERVMWTLLCCAGLLHLLRSLSPEAARVVLYAQVALEIGMVVAAVRLFLEFPGRSRAGHPESLS